MNTARQSPEARRLRRLIERLDLEAEDAEDADALAEAGTDAGEEGGRSHQERIKQYQQHLKQIDETKQELNEVVKKSQGVLSGKEITEVVKNSKADYLGSEG